jgi:hypothetical protein
LALVALAGSLAETGALTTADTAAAMLGAGGRFQIVKFHESGLQREKALVERKD